MKWICPVLYEHKCSEKCMGSILITEHPSVTDVMKLQHDMQNAFDRRLNSVEGQFDKLEGKKHDGGKPPMALLSGSALTEIAKVLEFGAKKYDAWNWKGGFKWTRLSSAVLRHIFSWLSGEDKDPETGLSHLAHASCGLMFLLDFEVNKLGEDDRYHPKIS